MPVWVGVVVVVVVVVRVRVIVVMNVFASGAFVGRTVEVVLVVWL